MQKEKFVLTNKRIINGEIREINDIFEEIFANNLDEMDDYDRHAFLEFNPCFNLEYKIIYNKLIKKSKEEIEQTCNDYLKGNIKLFGNNNEIKAFFQYTMNNVKYNEINTSGRSKK